MNHYVLQMIYQNLFFREALFYYTIFTQKNRADSYFYSSEKHKELLETSLCVIKNDSLFVIIDWLP